MTPVTKITITEVCEKQPQCHPGELLPARGCRPRLPTLGLCISYDVPSFLPQQSYPAHTTYTMKKLNIILLSFWSFGYAARTLPVYRSRTRTSSQRTRTRRELYCCSFQQHTQEICPVASSTQSGAASGHRSASAHRWLSQSPLPCKRSLQPSISIPILAALTISNLQELDVKIAWDNSNASKNKILHLKKSRDIPKRQVYSWPCRDCS